MSHHCLPHNLKTIVGKDFVSGMQWPHLPELTAINRSTETVKAKGHPATATPLFWYIVGDDSGQKGPGSSLLRGRPQPRGNKTRRYLLCGGTGSVTSAIPSPNLRDDGSASPSRGGAVARGGGVLVLLCLAARALPPARTTSPMPCTCPTGRGRGLIC
eukprot:scaffold29965_cov68-Phaeocystis_antarctica.AAC.2